jgi:hypothetical protein
MNLVYRIDMRQKKSNKNKKKKINKLKKIGNK